MNYYNYLITYLFLKIRYKIKCQVYHKSVHLELFNNLCDYNYHS